MNSITLFWKDFAESALFLPKSEEKIKAPEDVHGLKSLGPDAKKY